MCRAWGAAERSGHNAGQRGGRVPQLGLVVAVDEVMSDAGMVLVRSRIISQARRLLLRSTKVVSFSGSAANKDKA